MVDLTGRRALIVGGGRAALSKVEKLAEFGASLVVVAPNALPEFALFSDAERRVRSFQDSDLDEDWVLVVAATDDSALNRRVAGLCNARKIPVNVVDSPDDCSFFFPATTRRGSLTVAVSTGGASPGAAARINRDVAAALPENLAAILDALAVARKIVKKEIADRDVRKRVLSRLLDESLRRGRPVDGDEVRAFLADASSARGVSTSPKHRGRVALVGAGSGDASLITARGAELLKNADVVLYDELIDKRELELAPPGAEKLPVGKRCGVARARQDQINALLVERASRGLRVVRLKGGDPYVFGRGGEEAAALAAAGVPYEVAPGICSALYILMEAGIPATFRGASRSVHIVAARAASGDFAANVRALAPLEGTLVFLMGLGTLEQIAAELIAGGKSPTTPAAALSGGCAPRRVEIRGTLADIAQKTRANGVCAPVVVAVGATVAMDLRSPIDPDASRGESTSQGE